MNYNDVNSDLRQNPEEILYKPRFFSAANPQDRRAMEDLIRDMGPVLQIYDTLESQIREWVKQNNPQKKKLEETAYKEGVRAYLKGRPWEEVGTWVYYPWSRKLVRLLEEADFAFVRTAANRHKITEEEQARLKTKKIGVIGLSVGQSVAMVLAQERGFGELRLADFDDLELNNMNRIRSRVSDIGLPKGVCIAREIAELDPYLKVRLFDQGVREENIESFFLGGGKLDLVIDECDSVDIKIMARIWAKRLSVPVLMEASDRGTLDVERFDLDPHREIMHGWLAGLDLDLEFLKTLKTAEEKLPYILPISGLETLSPRMKASMLEIETSLTTWPQLASAVQLGGALTADTCRRILLDQFRESGRYFIDLEALIPAAPGGTDISVSAQTKDDPSFDESGLTQEVIKEAMDQQDLAPGEVKEEEKWKPLIEAALRAPSIGNMQPWKWVVSQGRFFFFHDRDWSRGDFKYMGALVSLGAAWENFMLAAHEAGMGLDYTLFPLGPESPLVASGRFLAQPGFSQRDQGPGDQTEGLYDPLYEPEQLAPWIHQRETNRRLGARKPLPEASLAAITQAMESVPGIRLHISTDEEELAHWTEMVGEAERLRLLDPQGHRSFFEEELRWNTDHAKETGDGVDLDSLDLRPAERAGLRLAQDPSVVDLLREWDKGRALGDMGKAAVRSASAIGLVTAESLHPFALFQAGRAIERAWLATTKEWLSLQPMLAPIYPISRIQHGGAEGMEASMVDAFHSIYAQIVEIFPEARERELVFLFRLSKAERPSVRSYRRGLAATLQTEAEL